MNDKRPDAIHPVKLRIEELVLHGFPRQDRFRIAEVVKQELAQLLCRSDLRQIMSQGKAAQQIDGGTIHLQSGSRAEDTGIAAARNIFGGLKK